MIKRKLVAGIAAVSMIAVLFTGCKFIEKDPAAIAKEVVAKVGDQKITRGEFDAMFNPYKEQFIAAYGQDNWDEETQKKNILDSMVMNALIQKEAKLLNIDVTDKEIEAKVTEYKGYFDNDEDKFNAFLKGQQLDLDSFQQRIKDDLISTKVRDALTKDVKVTDEEVQKYYDEHKDDYDQVKASHILVATEDEAKKVEERLKNGEDFATVAKEVSTDSGTKDKGGELGYFGKGDMVQEFSDAAFAAKVGEITAPVKSQYGYHIIKVEDRKQETFDEVKDQIRQQLLQKKQDDAYNKAIDDLKKDTKIEKYEKNLK